MWRPLAAFNGIDDPLRLRPGAHRCCCPPSTTSLGRACDVAEAQSRNASWSSIDGTPLPRRPGAAAGRRRRRRQPEPARPGRSCGSATRTGSCSASRGIEDRREARGRRRRATAATTPQPLITAEVTALEASSTPPAPSPSSAGTTPRTGSSAAGAPRPTRRSRRPTWRRRWPSGPGWRSARSTRRPRCSTTSARPGVSRLGVPRRTGPRDRARGRGQGRQVRVPRAEAGEGRARARRATQAEPLLLRQGSDLLRFRAVVTSAEQVKEVQVRGWDVAQKKALDRHRPGRRPTPRSSPARAPPRRSWPRRSAIRCTSPRTSPTAARPRSTPPRRRSRSRSRARSPSSRASPGATRRSGPGSAIAIDNLGAPFDGKYVVTSSRHVYDQATGYTTHFAVTGRQERSLFGLASGAGAAAGDRPASSIAQVSDARDPQHQGRVKLTFPWLSDDYVSDWARTVHAGAGKDRGLLVLPEVGDEVLVAFEQGDVRRPYVRRRAVQRRRHPQARPDRRRRRRLRRDQPPVAGVAPRAPDRPARPGRPQGGHRARDRRRQAHVHPRRHGQRASPCTATAA